MEDLHYISITTGNGNTASRTSALRNNSTGENNTTSGYQALYSVIVPVIIIPLVGIRHYIGYTIPVTH